MDVLPILIHPHPNLRKKAMPVGELTQEITEFIDRMIHTMYSANGIGLAAIQVNRPLRIVVIDISENRDSPQVFINPSIELVSGVQAREEGCLSVPDIYEEVERADVIRINAMDREGKQFSRETSGLESVCLQHEVDHLDGKMFVDYLSALKRTRIRKKLLKAKAAA